MVSVAAQSDKQAIGDLWSIEWEKEEDEWTGVERYVEKDGKRVASRITGTAYDLQINSRGDLRIESCKGGLTFTGGIIMTNKAWIKCCSGLDHNVWTEIPVKIDGQKREWAVSRGIGKLHILPEISPTRMVNDDISFLDWLDISRDYWDWGWLTGDKLEMEIPWLSDGEESANFIWSLGGAAEALQDGCGIDVYTMPTNELVYEDSPIEKSNATINALRALVEASVAIKERREMWRAVGDMLLSPVAEAKYRDVDGMRAVVDGQLQISCLGKYITLHIAKDRDYRGAKTADVQAWLDRLRIDPSPDDSWTLQPLLPNEGAELDVLVNPGEEQEVWRAFVVDGHMLAIIPRESVEWSFREENNPKEWLGERYILKPPEVNGEVGRDWLDMEELTILVPIPSWMDMPLRLKWNLYGAHEVISEMCE